MHTFNRYHLYQEEGRDFAQRSWGWHGRHGRHFLCLFILVDVCLLNISIFSSGSDSPIKEKMLRKIRATNAIENDSITT